MLTMFSLGITLTGGPDSWKYIALFSGSSRHSRGPPWIFKGHKLNQTWSITKESFSWIFSETVKNSLKCVPISVLWEESRTLSRHYQQEEGSLEARLTALPSLYLFSFLFTLTNISWPWQTFVFIFSCPEQLNRWPCPLVCLSDTTNNQSLHNTTEWP